MKSLALTLLLICSTTPFLLAQNSLANQAIDLINKEIVNRRKVVFKTNPVFGTLHKPGKIYMRGDILYVNDKERGLMVYDNTNPATPRFVRFVDIPGNYDVAMKDNMLYADSYNDLLAIDMNSQKTYRIRDVFTTAKTSSNAPKARVNSAQQQSAAVGGNTVKAGSMARFAITGNYLYVLDERTLKVFNISNPAEPQEVNKVSTSFKIETVYPVDHLLFVAGMEGVYIFDISNPANPQQQSIFTHALGCDPVVVQDGIAYITLRAGTNCNPNGRDSRLDIVDVTNPKKPALISTNILSQPRGLDVYKDWVYLCNNNKLEIYRVTGVKYGLTLTATAEVKNAYDVIYQSEKNRVVVVGDDGIHQFQYINGKLENLGLLAAGKPVSSDNGGNNNGGNNPKPFQIPNINLGGNNNNNLGGNIKLPNLGF